VFGATWISSEGIGRNENSAVAGSGFVPGHVSPVLNTDVSVLFRVERCMPFLIEVERCPGTAPFQTKRMGPKNSLEVFEILHKF
jgi:hypothetical protein